MTEQLDPRLDTLFATARKDLDGAAFTGRVMARTRFLRYRPHAVAAAVALLLLAATQFLVPSLRDLALTVAWGLTTNIVDLGEGWLAWIASPVNTVGSILVFLFKGVLMLRKRIREGSRR